MVESQHWSVFLIIFKRFSGHVILFYFHLFIFGNAVVCISFLFLACQSFQSHRSFFPSVPPCSLFSPKHKWMHGHLCWQSQAHTLEASHITLPCVTGCRIYPGPHCLKGWVGAWEKCVCVCVLYPVSSRSVNAGHQQIQSDFWVKYSIKRLQVFFWLVWTTALLNKFLQINKEKIVLPTVVLFWTFFIFWIKKILLKYFIMYLICLRIRG